MEYKHLKTGSSMISWRASARKRVFSVSPLLYYQYLWVGENGKSPWYLHGWRPWILQNFEFPHPFPWNSKQCREFSPVFPDIFPWLARGPTPGASRWHVHYTSGKPSLEWCSFGKIFRQKIVLPAHLRLLFLAFPHFSAKEPHNQTNATRRTA